MSIQRGVFVRPNNPAAVSLPRASVWRVVCTEGALKLDAENDEARRYQHKATARRFHNSNFDKVVLCREQWVSVRDEELLLGPTWRFGDDVQAQLECKPNSMFYGPNAVDRATTAADQAASTTAAVASLLEDARKVEAERKEELRIAKAAKAKADEEAAARVKMEEARKALAAKLYADRCLAEATLELIAEVSRLNNGGSEQVADASIAQHINQLQALAKSYGYRIAKPSMIALVVKL